MVHGSEELLAKISEQEVQNVDVRFCDLPGVMQHFTIPASSFGPEVFTEGVNFDGSSITGFQKIHESDMTLIPDPATAYVDPFRQAKAPRASSGLPPLLVCPLGAGSSSWCCGGA